MTLNKNESAHSDQPQPPTNPQSIAEQTDALHERGDRLAAGVAAHGKWVLIIAAVATLLGVGYTATQAWQRKADEKASDAYAEAVTLLQKGSRAPDSSEGKPEDDGANTDKAAAKTTEELQQVRQRFHQLRLDYSRSRVAELALLQEARLLVELGETKEAIAAYTTFLKNCRPQAHVCALGVLGKAAAQESLEDTKQALATLEQSLAGGQHQPGEPLIRWHIVRLANTLGLQEKARTQGMWLKENAPNAWVTGQADALVGLDQ